MTNNEITTICSPIKTLNDLFNVSSTCLINRFDSLQLIPRHTSPRQKILLCHDMKGGYLEDKHVQGCQTDQPCYRFFRWHLIDIFIYFSHELVTIPPVVWIDCAHHNGVQILGTFITEFNTGKEICRQLLESDESVDRAVDALALLMAWYSFDGYLLNIENPIEPNQITRLLSFVSKLKLACTKIDPNCLIIWYDSVTIHGALEWQNQLNTLNRPFFDACDGIFLNYTWQTEMLLQSRLNAGERYRDVFVGIDVFGRGCFGGGGFNTCEALALSYTNELSAAIFAPGWVFETLNQQNFLENDRKFWNSLELYTSQRILRLKSLTTFFSDGFGDKFFLHGFNISNNTWYHLGLQSYLPNVLNENQWLLNHTDGYFGGSCLEIQGDTKGYIRLFKCLMKIESDCEIVIVSKDADELILELKFDNGTELCLDRSAKETTIVRGWTRKTYQITIAERASITDISIHYTRDVNTSLKLGYLSIRPPKEHCRIDSLSPLIQSIEQHSISSIILHFVNSLPEQDPSSILFLFARNQLEEYVFLGAARQSYFVIFNSDPNITKDDRSMLVIRHYSSDSLELLNEQIISTSIAFECLRGFDSKKSE